MPSPAPIQDLIKTQLLLNHYFSNAAAHSPRPVPILSIDDGDIENVIEQKTSVLHGGLAISILLPFGQNLEPQHFVTCPVFAVTIAAAENSIINRASSGLQKPAYHAIRKLSSPWRADGGGGLNGWHPGPPFSQFKFIGFPDPFRQKTKSGNSLLVYTAVFETSEMIVGEAQN
jgi:hypothetical protein